jgi:hypothetical protein
MQRLARLLITTVLLAATTQVQSRPSGRPPRGGYRVVARIEILRTARF